MQVWNRQGQTLRHQGRACPHCRAMFPRIGCLGLDPQALSGLHHRQATMWTDSLYNSLQRRRRRKSREHFRPLVFRARSVQENRNHSRMCRGVTATSLRLSIDAVTSQVGSCQTRKCQAALELILKRGRVWTHNTYQRQNENIIYPSKRGNWEGIQKFALAERAF